jgi:hypothetical protein
MVAKFIKAIISLIYSKTLGFVKFVCLIIFVILMSNIYIVQAEPFIRIERNGITYYYFSTKGNNTILAHKISGDMRTSRPNCNKVFAQEVEPWINWDSQHHKLPSSLIKAVIRVESNFNPGATSPKGAQGLMQLMPGTAEQMQVANPYDIQENIEAGTRYLGYLLKKFNNNLPLALAAYNAGPQRVNKFQGVPPIKETQKFIRDVCTNFLEFSTNSPTPH